MGAEQIRLCARYSTLEPSHPLERLYIIREVGADRTCDFREGDRQSSGSEKRTGTAAKIAAQTTLLPPFAPYSHSIILSDRNALNSAHKFFLLAMKNRHPDPSEICALEFKGEFRRFGIGSVSATIGINWSIFDVVDRDSIIGLAVKKTVSLDRNSL
jgi:hypothetical protein